MRLREPEGKYGDKTSIFSPGITITIICTFYGTRLLGVCKTFIDEMDYFQHHS